MKNLLYSAFAFMMLATTASKAQDTYSTNMDVANELKAAADVDLLNVRYFYYPNLQAYFDRETSTYLYTRNGNDWIESVKLPNALRGYSMSNNKRVPISYTGDEPFEMIKEHMKQYPADYKTRRQPKDDEQKTTDLASIR